MSDSCRGLSIDKKPELQRVLENRRRDKIIQEKRQEEESKKMQSPFEQELLKRQQRLEQVPASLYRAESQRIHSSSMCLYPEKWRMKDIC